VEVVEGFFCAGGLGLRIGGDGGGCLSSRMLWGEWAVPLAEAAHLERAPQAEGAN